MERPHLKAGLTRLGLAADRLRTDRVGPGFRGTWNKTNTANIGSVLHHRR